MLRPLKARMALYPGDSESNFESRGRVAEPSPSVEVRLTPGLRLHRQEGVLGLYRGFNASVVTFVPSSAIWCTLCSAIPHSDRTASGSLTCPESLPHTSNACCGTLGCISEGFPAELDCL